MRIASASANQSKRLNPNGYAFYRSSNNWSADEDSKVVYRDTVQRVGPNNLKFYSTKDYTKNISQPIFSPGMVKTYSRRQLSKTPGNKQRRKLNNIRRLSIGNGQNQTPVNMKQFKPFRSNAFVHKPDGYSKKSKGRSSHRSLRSAKTLSRVLNKEKLRREHLEREAHDVKETLSNFYRT